MRIVIRTDASREIGTGHVFRCLSLAERLRNRGHDVDFACREFPGDLIGTIREKGYGVLRIPRRAAETAAVGGGGPAHWTGVDWEADADACVALFSSRAEADLLVVDHYALDRRWEEKIRPRVRAILVIDDLADRPHDCDGLLDQNFFEDPASRYAGLVPPRCRTFLGPRYALLRPEFIEERKTLRTRDGVVRRIFAFFGGVDPTGETGKFLRAMGRVGRPDIALDVVAGSSNPRRDLLEKACSGLPSACFRSGVDRMAPLMAKADLAVGAGGTTMWERCYLGLPCLAMILAENQEKPLRAAAAAGAVRNLGWNHRLSEADLGEAIDSALGDAAALREMGRKAMGLFGDGPEDPTDRLCDAVIGEGLGRT
jgi:UDP-2,4-diacetamido-2,4,6-trideoxy-beta-L-altropyranose hydrolase